MVVMKREYHWHLIYILYLYDLKRFQNHILQINSIPKYFCILHKFILYQFKEYCLQVEYVVNRVNYSILFLFIFIMTVSSLFYKLLPGISNNSKLGCEKSGCCAKQIISCGSNRIKPCFEEA